MRTRKRILALLAVVLLAGFVAVGCSTTEAGRDRGTPVTKETGPDSTREVAAPETEPGTSRGPGAGTADDDVASAPGGGPGSTDDRVGAPGATQPGPGTTTTTDDDAMAKDDGDMTGTTPLTAQRFVTQASTANLAEIKMAELAMKQAGSQGVKDLANHIMTDHKAAGEKLSRIAKGQKLTLATKLDAKHQKMVTELQGLRGAGFDRRYIEINVQAHNEAVSLFRQASQQLQGGLEDFAAQTLPRLQSHLAHAQQMQRDLTAGGDDGDGAGGTDTVPRSY